MNNYTTEWILVRVDFNISYNLYRLFTIIPTLQFFITNGVKLIIIAHHEPASESIAPFAELLNKFKIPATFAKDISEVHTLQKKENPPQVILLENLRMFSEEKKPESPTAHKWAQSLKDLAYAYVFEAPGVMHRSHTSLTILPQLFTPENRIIGPRVAHELAVLDNLKNKKPLIALLGGNKINEKLQYAHDMLPSLSHLILAPGLSCAVAQYLGKPHGAFTVDAKSLEIAQKLVYNAEAHNVTLVIPSDYLVSSEWPLTENSIIRTVRDTEILPTEYPIALGSTSIAHTISLMAHARSVIVNGGFGVDEIPDPHTMDLKNMAQRIAAHSGKVTIAGGSTVSAYLKYINRKTRVELLTAGGAALAYLAHHSLPVISICTEKNSSQN